MRSRSLEDEKHLEARVRHTARGVLLRERPQYPRCDGQDRSAVAKPLTPPDLRSVKSGGRIVNFTSTSVKSPIDNLILSNTFRTGVLGLSKTLASELGRDGILINVLSPGRIQTDRLERVDQIRAQKAGTSIEQVRADACKTIPLGRYGTVDEYAKNGGILGFSRQYIHYRGTTMAFFKSPSIRCKASSSMRIHLIWAFAASTLASMSGPCAEGASAAGNDLISIRADCGRRRVRRAS